MTQRRVTRRYALNEFKTVGLVLIIYSFFVLFIPFVLDELFALYNIGEYKGINLLFASKTLLLIIGTILPFSLLQVANKGFKKPRVRVKLNFGDILKQAIVFFSFTSAAIFATTSVASYFNISGTLISGIGIALNAEYLGNWQYVSAFIVISPILEEFAFRRVMLNSLSKYGKFFALHASALMFALAHGSFLEFIPCYIMATLLGKIALRYKSIKPTIAIHILFNAVLYLLCIIPDNISLYSGIVLAIIYIIAVILVLFRKYRHIVVKKPSSYQQVMSMFLTSYPVLLAMFLFIAHSVLSILIA